MYEPDKGLANTYSDFLRQENYEVTCASNLDSFKNKLQQKKNFELIIVDINCQLEPAVKFFHHIKNYAADIPIIVNTNSGSIQSAINLMRLGASDYLVKPFTLKKLKDSLMLALKGCGQKTKEKFSQTKNISANNYDALVLNKFEYNYRRFIGTSSAMQIIYSMLEAISSSDLPVFITGETGTGKEVCAESIHYYSDRAYQPFIPINCATFTSELATSNLFGHKKGAFTSAIENRDGAIAQSQGGTLFLDEICEMPLEMPT